MKCVSSPLRLEGLELDFSGEVRPDLLKGDGGDGGKERAGDSAVVGESVR